MKKAILVLLLMTSFMSFSQEKNELPIRNELSSNLLDLVVAGSLNINYERLLNNNQSYVIGTTLFDTYGYYDVGYIEKNSAFSLKAAYIIYFAKEKEHEGFYFFPQLKVRTGEITVNDYGYYDYDNNIYIDEEFKYDVSGLSAGFGIGHKWLFYEEFTLSISGEVARNLGDFDDDYLDVVEARFGINFGYRF